MKNLFSFMNREKSFLNAKRSPEYPGKYGFRHVTFEEALANEIEELEHLSSRNQ